jgi:hypothetical protein
MDVSVRVEWYLHSLGLELMIVAFQFTSIGNGTVWPSSGVHTFTWNSETSQTFGSLLNLSVNIIPTPLEIHLLSVTPSTINITLATQGNNPCERRSPSL